MICVEHVLVCVAQGEVIGYGRFPATIWRSAIVGRVCGYGFEKVTLCLGGAAWCSPLVRRPWGLAAQTARTQHQQALFWQPLSARDVVQHGLPYLLAICVAGARPIMAGRCPRREVGGSTRAHCGGAAELGVVSWAQCHRRLRNQLYSGARLGEGAETTGAVRRRVIVKRGWACMLGKEWDAAAGAFVQGSCWSGPAKP